MKKILFLFMLVLAAVLTAAAQDDADALSVDASASMGAINPYVYGSNLNLYATLPMSLLEEAQALGLNFMRYNGNTSGEDANLRTNLIDLFILQMQMIDAEPLLTVRLLNGTPEAAAEFVRYTNIEKGYNVRYWSIGNEPSMFTDKPGIESYTALDLATQWRAIAEAMLAVDPDIIFVGPDISQYVPLTVDGDTITYLPSQLNHALDADGRDWLIEFLRVNGDLIDYVSIHRYPYGGRNNSNPTRDQLRANLPEWDVLIQNVRQIVNDVTGRDIPIAVTEFNSNSDNNIGGDATLESHFNAIWLGDVLGRMINNGVAIATHWDLQGGSNRGWGLLGAFDVRPSAYTYMMYTHFGEELLSAASPDPNVTIYAARRADGALTLMVINLGETEVEKTLDIAGFTPAGDAEVWRFDEAAEAIQIEPQSITDGAVITLPPLSMTVYVIPGDG